MKYNHIARFHGYTDDSAAATDAPLGYASLHYPRSSLPAQYLVRDQQAAMIS